MRALIIGFGSIGKRHYEVLSGLNEIENVDLVTKQTIENTVCYSDLESVVNIVQYDYFIIASETNKHFEQLEYLENTVTDKLILCEKPLFQTKQNLEIKNNKVFVGYVLRFHPLLEKLIKFIQDEKIIVAYAKCGQYLPLWRPDTDYRKCYSAKKIDGGGVLLDLSHEIDYVQWLCGQIIDVKSYQTKVSDLEIDSDDLTMLIGRTNKSVFVNISIDYISKQTHRSLLLETIENTYKIDFISNRLVKKNKVGIEEVYSFSNLERNYMFEKMHLDAINDCKVICSLKEAMNVMETISTIQEQNK
ncbi:Gfo/Idh/MocA family protein [Francisella frigiditurris]|uniref:Oxidoreductase, NAD-binding Rossmann fold family protein n=1 Tax=Francisella frigiditurris TaxID=1542390 RepID=A0A1J0KW13_9GAMM|nr:Gfo/Idh/MocA family oxidoreductase [Francisella frigiditurris]APC97961.1 oxidoreductase, NAD-binding Rossmann fold family protein [Francisella frigiditurris]